MKKREPLGRDLLRILIKVRKMFFFHGNFDMAGTKIEKSLIRCLCFSPKCIHWRHPIIDFSITPIALHGNVGTGALGSVHYSSVGSYFYSSTSENHDQKCKRKISFLYRNILMQFSLKIV